MKHKILGLLAVGLVAGPMAAKAVVIYEYTEASVPPTTDWSFSYASPTFISSDTSLADYPCLTSICDIDFFLTGFSNTIAVSPPGDATAFRDFPQGAFGAVGSYNAVDFLGRLLGTLVVSEVAVSEPGTLALFGLGLLGLWLTRRRAN